MTSDTLATYGIYGQEDAAAGPSRIASINPVTYPEYNGGDTKDSQYNMNLFSDLLAPEISNTAVSETDQATELIKMGVVLTN